MIPCPHCGRAVSLIPKSHGEIRDEARRSSELAREAMFEAQRRALQVDRYEKLNAIAAAVAEFYYLTLDAMLEAGNKQHDVVRPRQVAAYLMQMASPDVAHEEIASILGRERSTISHSVAMVRKRMKKDADFRAGVERVAGLLGLAA